jgi:DNA-binding response OmpR family regulator
MPSAISIFLIEDDHDDREFLEVALTDNNIKYQLEAINRGDLIIDWLKTCQTVPDIIIMDLNLPKLHGREVICRIKENERFNKVPFLVLTTSSSIEDKQYCLKKGADKFFSKPSDTDGFKELVTAIVQLAKKKRVATS